MEYLCKKSQSTQDFFILYSFSVLVILNFVLYKLITLFIA